MEQEELTPRVGILETQVTSLVTMMTEMKILLEASHARQTTLPDLNNTAQPSLSNTADKGQIEDAQHIPELNHAPNVSPQHKAPPVVINLEKGEKGKPTTKPEEGAKRLAKIEECLSSQGYELARFDKISPFAKLEVPPDYKEPDFVRKYSGTGCPRAHLKYYLRKMAHYSDYVPLLMNTFQESLSGAALAWFIDLDLEDYDGWEDLAEDFLHQYKFNTATAPNREDLLRTVKGKNELIRTYAQRWRALATQVKPPIPEDELVDLFLKALPFEYFDRLNTSGCQTFVHLIKVAERLEWAMRERKAPEVPMRRQYPLKKEREAGVDVAFVSNPPKSKQFANSNPMQGGSSWSAQKMQEPKKRQPPKEFTPLPRPLSKLLPMLLEEHLVAKEPPRPNPPKFSGYDESQSCAYHMGERGHNVDNCYILKLRVQALIDNHLVEFDKMAPNVQHNPLPDHQVVGMIFDGEEENLLEFKVNTDKLYDVLAIASSCSNEGEMSMERKMLCLTKLMSLGIIAEVDDETFEGVLAHIDLSWNQFMVGIEQGDSWRMPRESLVDDEENEDESKAAQERNEMVDNSGSTDDATGPEVVGNVAIPSPKSSFKQETLERFSRMEEEVCQLSYGLAELSSQVGAIGQSQDTIDIHALQLCDQVQRQNHRILKLDRQVGDLIELTMEMKRLLNPSTSTQVAPAISVSNESFASRKLAHLEAVYAKYEISSRIQTSDNESEYGLVSEDLDDLIGMVGTASPFVIKLNEVDNWKSEADFSAKPIVIRFSEDEVEDEPKAEAEKKAPVIIKVPPVEEYDPRAVHWSYGTGEIDAVMRSGRFYAPREVEPEKKEVSKEDAEKLLSIVKTSEFDVIEQLRKMPAQISLLDLFTNSEKHKSALMRVLNEVHVPETINEVQLEDFVGTILLKDQLSFSDEDFPMEGRVHNKALYVTAHCHGKRVAHVLIDNGSAFNICPLATLRRMGIKEDLIRTSTAIIRAFDGARKTVVGEIELDVLIGPTKFSIDFQVMDLPSAFGFLLGRPWIHTAGALPSSLHQKVRFVVDGKVITVHGEVDLLVYQDSAVPYIEPELKQEASYHSLDIVAVVHTPVGTRLRVPFLSQFDLLPAKMLLAYGFVPGEGLGKFGQGIRVPLQLQSNDRKIGLGYGYDHSGSSTFGKRHGGRGRGRGRGESREGHGRQGGRGVPFIGSCTWKGRSKMFDSPLNEYFCRSSKWLANEKISPAAEPDLTNPFLDDDTVNVIIEWLDDDATGSE